MRKLWTILLAGLLICMVSACGLVETDTTGTRNAARRKMTVRNHKGGLSNG